MDLETNGRAERLFRKNKDKFITCFYFLSSFYLETCNDQVLDLGFILDSSGSVGRRNWRRMKDFTKNLISNITKMNNNTRISIIVFGTNPVMEITFDEPYSPERVNNLRHLKGYTFIDRALRMAAQVMFTEENGMRRHSIKVNVVI